MTALWIVAIASLAATLAFVVYAYLYSPQNPVASEMAFEALRVAKKRPLYVNPWVGAWEDGAPPARFYVLYTPIFPALVGKLAAPTLASVIRVGRTIAVAAWAMIFAPAVAFAPRERRAETALAAMLAASVFFLSRHAASMSADALATALVCGGVLRAVLKDEIDPLAAVLIACAPFVKPSCLGGAAGAGLTLLVQHRPRWWRGALAGAAAILACVGVCHLASDGAWLSNIASSTGQPLTLTRWMQEMGGRLPILGIPHVVVIVYAWRRRTSWLVLGPLAGSLAWTTFMMAKHGSGSHYWFEPTGLAVIAISRIPLGAPAPRWVPFAGLAFGVLSAISSWPGYLAEPRRARAYFAKVAAVDAHCVRGPGDFVVSSDFDYEMMLNGRISVPSWQSAFLARTGKFPLREWQEDLARPEVKWVTVAIDPRLPITSKHDEQVELSPFGDILKGQLDAHFDFDAKVGDMFVFKRTR